MASEDKDNIKELERVISTQAKQIQYLNEERERLTASTTHYKSLSEDLNTLLQSIYNSNGWKVMSKYYKLRDSLRLPKFSGKGRKDNKQGELHSTNQNEGDKVSIIIPVYNNVPYLEKCIHSALAQTYHSFEVVVVDDCSPDPAVATILESFTHHPNYKYIRNDFNCGISETMNQAIIHSSGNWIAFLDCDDWLDAEAIEKLMACLKAKEGAVYGYTDRYNEIEKDGTSKVETFRSRPTSNYLQELLVGMYTSHLKMIHKDVFIKIGLHESRFDGAQDYDIALKTAFHYQDAFAYLPEPVYHHRIHDKQTTQEAAARIEGIVTTIKSEIRQRIEIRNGNLDKLVSFVILSFEKMEMTLKCVQSIKDTVKVAHEIIIFDNASTPETVQYLKDHVEAIDGVTIHYSDRNLGCPGGRRTATKLAQGDYIINLDNDILVTEGWFEEIITRAEQSPNIGAVCCKTVFPTGKIQFNGASYALSEGFITFLLTDTDKDENEVSTALWHECSWVPGGATLFKREVVDHLDYSEGYINAFEDNDVALQIAKLNYRMVNCPTSKVYHYHIMHDKAQVNKEKEYMRVRYNNEGFIQSLVNFYKRNQLIINDPFVHRLMNVEGLEKSAIIAHVQELSNQDALRRT
ncbi:glycosyltransferase [Paenibacillus oenotherae]|uniref:Glycosyltransferase n=1 Tax=Paenibacillus oenotherae TaxID=1435645 RepID=A0ABS7D5F6_9BACL|nr:glycosyltransferase [Paenibacillus oenotherae]MBW7475061.1 glycosyltransferase [Paenibacillus oenotherae]